MSQSHGWIPVMNPPAPNIPPVQCSINEAPVLHEGNLFYFFINEYIILVLL